MARFDKPLEELQNYLPDRAEPGDFDRFWAETLANSRQHPLDPIFKPVNFGLHTVEAYDVTFSGYGGQRIKGWLLLPRQREGLLPAVVEYIGYGGGRGFPLDWLTWSSAGYAHLVMDTRGQGSAWLRGDTPDSELEGGNPQFPGFMTRGILAPATYYYRRVFADAVRAVECMMPVAGLSPALLANAVKVSMPDVPFLCHYRRATELVDTHPYQEIVRFCKVQRDQIETVFATLAYLDGVNFAARATARSLFSVALMDDICPPSTVYAAYNHYLGEKQIRVYSYNQHEGGQSYQKLEQLHFLAAQL